MIKINIKPLSVNKAWKGRRQKSHYYKQFESDMLLMLPKKHVIPEGELWIVIEYGFSSRASDLDNPTKMVLDILSKKYDFNDNRIYYLTLRKEIVKKGQEYVKFKINKKPLVW